MIRINQNLSIIAITVLTIGAISVFTIYLHQTSEKKVLSQFQRYQLVHAQQVINKIESYLLAQTLALRAIASSPSFQNGDSAEKAAGIQAYFQQLKHNHVSAVSVCDEAGTVTFSTEQKTIGQNYGQQDFFLWVKKKENRTKAFIFPSPEPDRMENSKWDSFRFLLIIPVYQEAFMAQGLKRAEIFVGTISFVVDLGKYLREQLDHADPELKLDQLWIMDNSGTLWFHSQHPEMALKNIHQTEKKCNGCHISFGYVEKILKEEQGTVSYQLKSFPKRIAAFSPMKFENISWVVALNSSYDEMTAFARKSLWGHLGLLAAVGFFFALGLTIIRRNDRMKLIAEERSKHLHEKFVEQRNAQEALRRSEEKYRILVETMNEGLAVIDNKAFFTFVNDRFCRMLGYSQEEIIGRPVINFLEGRPQKILDEQMEQRREGRHKSLEVGWARKDGQKIVTLVSPQIITGNEGGVQGTFAIIMDITQRKQSEEALQESERKLRSLSAQLMIAQETERKRISRELHDELGQALNIMKMRVSFIKRNLEGDQAGLREDCEATVQYIGQTIENVRRISRDLRPSVLEDFGLSAALKWLTGHFKSNYNIPVSLNLDGLDLSFQDDTQILIYRVLQEALTNIGKHAGATEVSMSVTKRDEMISFQVKDNGKGFDLDQAVGKDDAEIRLGLSTMMERAHMLGGSLEISTQEGQGTTVILTIPFARQSVS